MMKLPLGAIKNPERCLAERRRPSRIQRDREVTFAVGKSYIIAQKHIRKLRVYSDRIRQMVKKMFPKKRKFIRLEVS